MLALATPDAAWGGIVAFYSIIHLPPEARPQALAEFYRALQPGACYFWRSTLATSSATWTSGGINLSRWMSGFFSQRRSRPCSATLDSPLRCRWCGSPMRLM